MVEARYNMADILGAAFGQVPLAYAGMDGIDRDAAVELAKSSMGTPVHFRFGIAKGNYGAFNGGRYELRQVASFQFPLSTMVSIGRSKRDRITPVSSGEEHVVEMYSFNPWEVRIQGVCVDDPSHPQAISAVEQRKRIMELEGLADSIRLQEQAGLFTDLGIYELYIRSVRFGQLQGSPNMLPFELSCLSMKPLELRST